jgi:transcriptional/translational regulatory protein YebC/TACO1
MRRQGLSYDQAERKAIEAAAEDGKDRYVVGGDEGYSVATAPPQVGRVHRHITAAHAAEFMSQEPTTTQALDPRGSGHGKIRRPKRRT